MMRTKPLTCLIALAAMGCSDDSTDQPPPSGTTTTTTTTSSTTTTTTTGPAPPAEPIVMQMAGTYEHRPQDGPDHLMGARHTRR